jgi:hypothetical protein
MGRRARHNTLHHPVRERCSATRKTARTSGGRALASQRHGSTGTDSPRMTGRVEPAAFRPRRQPAAAMAYFFAGAFGSTVSPYLMVDLPSKRL